VSRPTQVLFVCDHAPVPSWLRDPAWTTKQIRSRGPDAELDLHLQVLGSVLHQEVSPRSADLVRIAAYVHRADTMVSRGGERDDHGAAWKRRMILCLPVADLTYWGNPDVTKRLVAALEFATGDTWEFAFSQGALDDLPELRLDIQQREVLHQPKVVTLFSGGVDSLCALLEAAASGERPLAVGHWSAEVHQARQQRLLEEVSRRLTGWSFPYLGFKIHRAGEEWAESSQRSRAFLFASLGAAVAGELGIHRVYVADNGPVSLNLPINDQLVGALASRSTHPKFLALFNRFLDGLFPHPVVVSNPLAAKTRVEALRSLTATKCEALLPLTLSCSRWSRLPQATPHCGGCSQCVDRRFATIAAGLEAYDPASAYKLDLFRQAPEDWEAEATIRSYVTFAQQVRPLDNDEMVQAFPQLRDAVVREDRDPERALLSAIDVVKRHVATVLDAYKAMVIRHADEIAAGTLPPGCLLQLAPAGMVPAPAEAPMPPTIPAPLQPPDAPPRQQALPATGDENWFAFVGKVWRVRYRGLERFLTHTDGYLRIAYLLGHPGRSFQALEIVAATTVRDAQIVGEADAEADGLSVQRYGRAGPILTPETRTQYEARVSELLIEMDEARDAGDQERVTSLDDEIKHITHEITAATGLGGRPRTFADHLSDSQDAVYRSIHRAIPRIKKVHPALGSHLDQTIVRSTVFAYRQPEGEPDWHVELPTG
jgi:7-cyano-7-deazaguanine synthase in queuosine biosynthesis